MKKYKILEYKGKSHIAHRDVMNRWECLCGFSSDRLTRDEKIHIKIRSGATIEDKMCENCVDVLKSDENWKWHKFTH